MQRFWNWLKPCIIPFIFGMFVGGMLLLAVCRMNGGQVPPLTHTLEQRERVVLAEQLEHIANEAASGVDRYIIDEHIRTAIASQPGSGRWAEEVNTMLQNATSSDPTVFANNLRHIAHTLKNSSPQNSSPTR